MKEKSFMTGDFVRTERFDGYPNLVEDMEELVGKMGRVERKLSDGTMLIRHPQASHSWLWPQTACIKVDPLEEIKTLEQMLKQKFDSSSIKQALDAAGVKITECKKLLER